MSIVITAIKKIYEEEGVEVYLDKYRYYSLAEDYISDKDDQFLKELYYCAENNILKLLYQIHKETSPQECEKYFLQAKNLFLRYQYFSEEEAFSFFQNYVDAFGWKVTNSLKTQDNSKSGKNTSTEKKESASMSDKPKENQEKNVDDDDEFEELLRKVLDEMKDSTSSTQDIPPKIVSAGQSTNSGKNIKHSVKKKHYFLRALLFCIVVFAGYFGIGFYQSNSYIKNIEDGISDKSAFLEAAPFMDHVLDRTLKTAVDKTVKSYNKGKSGYEEATEKISVFASSEINEYALEKLNLLEKLSTSKQAYEQGTAQAENKNYIEAAQSLSNVIEEDSLYKKSKKLKKKIKKDFTEQLISEITNTVSNADYANAVKFADIGGKCYPSDDELSGLKKAGDDCGNPFIYQIVHNIYKNIKKVEKDKDNQKQDCYSMMAFKLNNTHFLLGALFGTVNGSGVSDYSIVCYDIVPDGITKISQSEYEDSMKGQGKLEKLEFKWDPDISKKDKEEKLYTQFIKMGPTYEGDTSGVSYITQNEPAETSSSNQPSFFKLFGVVGLEFLAVFIGIAILVGSIKKILG